MVIASSRHYVVKYLRLYVSQPEFESGGAMWIARFGVVECLMGALFLAQCIHCGVIGVKFSTRSTITAGTVTKLAGVSTIQWAWILTLPLPLITAFVYVRIRGVIDSSAQHLPLDIAVAVDSKFASGCGDDDAAESVSHAAGARKLAAAATAAACDQALEGTLRWRYGFLDEAKVRETAEHIGPVAAYVHPALYARSKSVKPGTLESDGTIPFNSVLGTGLSAEGAAHQRVHEAAARELQQTTRLAPPSVTAAATAAVAATNTQGLGPSSFDAGLCVAATGSALLDTAPFDRAIEARLERNTRRRALAETRCRALARTFFCCRHCECGKRCWIDEDDIAIASSSPSVTRRPSRRASPIAPLGSTLAINGAGASRPVARASSRDSIAAFMATDTHNAVFGLGMGDADYDVDDIDSVNGVRFTPQGSRPGSRSATVPVDPPLSSASADAAALLRNRSGTQSGMWAVDFITALTDAAEANQDVAADDEFSDLLKRY